MGEGCDDTIYLLIIIRKDQEARGGVELDHFLCPFFCLEAALEDHPRCSEGVGERAGGRDDGDGGD